MQRLKKQLTNISEPSSPINSDNHTLLLVKSQLEQLYKKMLLEFRKTYDGEMSMYTMISPDFCTVEHEMNQIIMQLQDSIENKRTKSIVKQKSLLDVCSLRLNSGKRPPAK